MAVFLTLRKVSVLMRRWNTSFDEHKSNDARHSSSINANTYANDSKIHFIGISIQGQPWKEPMSTAWANCKVSYDFLSDSPEGR